MKIDELLKAKREQIIAIAAKHGANIDTLTAEST